MSGAELFNHPDIASGMKYDDRFQEVDVFKLVKVYKAQSYPERDEEIIMGYAHQEENAIKWVSDESNKVGKNERNFYDFYYEAVNLEFID